MRVLIFVYSVVAYLLANLAILYAIAFLGDFAFAPLTVDRGAEASSATAVIIDLLLLGLFAIQHSVMARPAFKRAWTRIVPPAAERSTYVLAAAAALAILYLNWRPIPAIVWDVPLPAARAALWVLFWAGWAILLGATFMIDHFELFGLSQGWGALRGAGASEGAFKTPGLYRVVRHPIYLGLILGFWSIPTMSLGHLLFAVGGTGYIFVGIWFEERDLMAVFGERYRDYRRRVSMIVPWAPRTAKSTD
jgi:protein-S-isoprenylcysteine O-methyltransferase Ste14